MPPKYSIEECLIFFGRNMDFILEKSFYRNSNIYLALACIKLIRNDDSRYDFSHTEFQHMMFKIISRVISEFIDNDRCVFDVLTVNEHENLMWYLENNEKEFGRKAIEKIRRQQ